MLCGVNPTWDALRLPNVAAVQQFAPNGQVAQSPMKAEARRFGMIGHGSQFIEMQKL